VAFTTSLAITTFTLVLDYIRKNKTKFSFVLNWLFTFSLLNLLSVVFIIAYVAGIIGFNNLRFSYADLLMHLAAFVNVVVALQMVLDRAAEGAGVWTGVAVDPKDLHNELTRVLGIS
jgi:hypothetical protein